MAAAVVIVTGLPIALTASVARADQAVTIGETTLTPNAGIPDTLGQNVPVFQGDVGSGYAVSVSQAGTITSWSFLSAGIATGKQFVLRVVRPSGSSWLAVATSNAVAVTTAAGNDAVNGPFAVSLVVAPGDRIALQPVDDSLTPIEQGTAGTDGIRYFTAPFADGTANATAPGSDADNGQIVPIQATLDVSATPPPPPPVSNTTRPMISGTVRAGEAVTCDPGTWTGANLTFTYLWTVDEVFSLPQTLPASWHRKLSEIPPQRLALTSVGRKRHGKTSVSLTWKRPTYDPVTARFSAARTIVVPDYVAFDTTKLPNHGYPTALTCTVTATDGRTSVSASSVPVQQRVAKPALQDVAVRLRVRSGRPSIGTNTGVGGTNHCTTGEWLHHPTSYSYAWYRLDRSTRQTLHPRTRIASGPAWTIPASAEGTSVECVVTARNGAGSTEAASLAYTVPLTGPVSLDGPWIIADTTGPRGGGLVGPGDTGATFIASHVHLSCDPGRWNRSDLTFTYYWLYNDASSYLVYGGSTRAKDMTFDAPPDAVLTAFNSANGKSDKGYGGLFKDGDFGPFDVRCFVRATTSHGVSSTQKDDWGTFDVASAVVDVWNGCSAVEDVDSSTGIDLSPFIDVTTSGNKVTTRGPNCAPYQAAYEGEGFDVHQEG